MTQGKAMVGLFLSAVFTLGLTACEEGPAERAGERLDRATERAGESVERAGERAQDKVD